MTSSFPQSEDVPPFPSPSTFSILPDIYLLLSRLDVLNNANVSDAINTADAPNGVDATATGLDTGASTIAAAPLVGSPNDVEMNTGFEDSQTLRLKDLQYNLHPIRMKIQAAKDAVLALPDLERSAEEQRVELEGLERKVKGLRARLSELSTLAGQGRERGGQNGAHAEYEVMEGIETGG